MKNLDFTFPVLKNEEKTRLNHIGKCEKTKDVEIELPSIDEIVRDIIEANNTGQKGVKAIKTNVNAMMYNHLVFEADALYFPKSYATALYLNNFDEINKLMEEASKEIYETLNG